MLLINAAFLLAFLVRYGWPFPPINFVPYQKSFIYLTLIYTICLLLFDVYRRRFRSSWDLFRRVLLGLSLGTLLSVAFVYVFREQWGGFSTSTFLIAYAFAILLVFKADQFILRSAGRIRKRTIVIGKGSVDGLVRKRSIVDTLAVADIRKLAQYKDIDEIVVCRRLENREDFTFLLYYLQTARVSVLFSPALYLELLPQRINGHGAMHYLGTMTGQGRDIDEFLIRALDIAGSIAILILMTPAMLVAALLIRLTSSGPVFYTQQRVGKDGVMFTLYKFRTMIRDAEKHVGPVLASTDDPRVTRVGKVLRRTRLDELPQLFNVLMGDMSLVGPRPERPHFVKQHRVLRELRLAVKPGLTGLAQIRSFYDLKPKHKIKYDYLYIQRRSLLLNLFILLKTVPVVFSKKGW